MTDEDVYEALKIIGEALEGLTRAVETLREQVIKLDHKVNN